MTQRELEAKLLRQVEAGELTLVEASMLLESGTRSEMVAYLSGMERPSDF